MGAKVLPTVASSESSMGLTSSAVMPVRAATLSMYSSVTRLSSS